MPPNAVVEYTVTLTSFERTKETWAMDSEEIIEQAKIYKEKGTNYFKQSKFAPAQKMYGRVLKLVEGKFVSWDILRYKNSRFTWRKAPTNIRTTE